MLCILGSHHVYINKNKILPYIPNILNIPKVYLLYITYYEYVDDILVIYNENYTDIEEVQKSFSNITRGLNFNLELEKDNKLNFLDLILRKTANKLSFDIYRKHPSTDTIIPHD
jgi:hypothetical protein